MYNVFIVIRLEEKIKQKNIRKKHPEETFKLKISENNLTKYNFRKELPQRARSITSDDDDGIVIIHFYLSKVIAYYVFCKLLIF
jgi:hypothetical protein